MRGDKKKVERAMRCLVESDWFKHLDPKEVAELVDNVYKIEVDQNHPEDKEVKKGEAEEEAVTDEEVMSEEDNEGGANKKEEEEDEKLPGGGNLHDQIIVEEESFDNDALPDDCDPVFIEVPTTETELDCGGREKSNNLKMVENAGIEVDWDERFREQMERDKQAEEEQAAIYKKAKKAYDRQVEKGQEPEILRDFSKMAEDEEEVP